MELGIESGRQLAIASSASDFGFGWMSSISDSAEGFAARLQASAQKVARQLNAVLAKRSYNLTKVAADTAAIAPQTLRDASRPMTLADQWSKVSAVLARSVDGARIATDMQSAATQQLDLAQYGLITLVDELSAVMSIPGRRSRSATVHAFNGTSADSSPMSGRALAA